MSTRAMIHFVDSCDPETIEARVFRHTDGYPEGLGKDIKAFFNTIIDQIGINGDTRFNDPTMLAARWVVYDALQMRHDPTRPLDFLSVRIMQEDSCDVEYIYTIVCDESDKIPIIIIKEI